MADRGGERDHAWCNRRENFRYLLGEGRFYGLLEGGDLEYIVEEVTYASHITGVKGYEHI
jgi:hypothetical protein